LLQDGRSGSPRHNDLRVDDDVSRQFMQRLQVMPECLLDEMALLYSSGANMPLQQIPR
jgi:hypothetical protein